jgi:ABC-type multidrug transport system ATPase subunit
MSLLELDGACKSYGRGAYARVVLRSISFELDAGELVGVWGLRRSGRSTLLRVAAGVEAPDTGAVRLAGCDLAARGGDLARGAIGYCVRTMRPAEGGLVLEQLVVDQLTRGVAAVVAGDRARVALERVGASACAALRPGELDGTDSVRVAIARVLARRPKLLVIDDPVLGVELMERDSILRLLRSLADDGIAVLMSASQATGLAGADRALSLSGGELRGSPTGELAPVVELRTATR